MSTREACGLLVLALAATSAGCAASGTAGMPSRIQPTLPNLEMSTQQAIEKHNLNASRLVNLQAEPRIAVTAPDVPKGSVTGRMALERPKNFKLEMMSGFGDKLADIGSNESEFWFWTKSKKDRAVYVCSYEDVDRSPLSAAFQPDWIVEAMGLRPITADEAAQMKAERGESYGTTKLVSSRRGRQGEVLVKETIIDGTGRIVEHRLYEVQKNRRTLLALATVERYQDIPISNASAKTASLPYQFHLEWVPQRLALDIQLDKARVREFNAEARREIFAEPHPAGAARVNLADHKVAAAAGAAAGASARNDSDDEPAAPSVRQSRPMPNTRSAVRLGTPEALGSGRDAVNLSPDLESVDPNSSRP